jgi:hypothetical protein
MSNMKRINGTTPLVKAAALGVAVVAFASGQQAAASDTGRAQALRMYERLTGTPPSKAVLDDLETQIGATPTDATREAVAAYIINPANATSLNFYTVTLKNFATPWTNRDQSIFAPLNDYTATVIGLAKDDADFKQVLFEDVVYIGSGAGVPAFSPTSNAHYEALESENVDLRGLTRTTQSSLNGLPPAATAGVITSRAASEAFFIDGTNRAMFRFTLLNHMCRDMEQIHDTSRPPDRIRQDVTRSPGGDSSVFNNNCIGCHSVMDSMAQAFAYYDFDETAGRLVYTPGQVQPKYLINSDNFKPGFVTPDDTWDNRMRLPGKNDAVVLQWAGAPMTGHGNGAKSLGQEFAYSGAFAECQAEKVFRKVCFRSPNTSGDHAAIDDMKNTIWTGNGSLRRVFARAAAQCAGQ